MKGTWIALILVGAMGAAGAGAQGARGAQGHEAATEREAVGRAVPSAAGRRAKEQQRPLLAPAHAGVASASGG